MRVRAGEVEVEVGREGVARVEVGPGGDGGRAPAGVRWGEDEGRCGRRRRKGTQRGGWEAGGRLVGIVNEGGGGGSGGGGEEGLLLGRRAGVGDDGGGEGRMRGMRRMEECPARGPWRP